MGRIDTANNVGLFNVLPKISRDANATIQGANVSEFHGAAFVIDAGDHTSGGGFDVKLQHRNGSGTWTDIPASQLAGVESNDIEIRVGDANKKVYVGYTGSAEQIGAVLTRVTTGIMVLGVSVVTSNPTTIPPVNR
jgi:hypothetical protein